MEWWSDVWAWLQKGELGWLDVLVGGVVGWGLGRKTSQRVDETHDKLTWLMIGLERKGLVTFKRDENGNITDVVVTFEISAAVSGTSVVTADATVTTRKRPWWDPRRLRP